MEETNKEVMRRMRRLTRNAKALLAQLDSATKKRICAKTEEARLRHRKHIRPLVKNGLERPRGRAEAVAILTVDFLEQRLRSLISSRAHSPFGLLHRDGIDVSLGGINEYRISSHELVAGISESAAVPVEVARSLWPATVAAVRKRRVSFLKLKRTFIDKDVVRLDYNGPELC